MIADSIYVDTMVPAKQWTDEDCMLIRLTPTNTIGSDL